MVSLLPLPRHPSPSLGDLTTDHRHRLGMAKSSNRLVFVFGHDFGAFAPFSLADLLTRQLNLVNRYDFLMMTDAEAFPDSAYIYLNNRPLIDGATNKPFSFTRAKMPEAICAIHNLIRASLFRPRLR
jgi:hypothetical protein